MSDNEQDNNVTVWKVISAVGKGVAKSVQLLGQGPLGHVGEAELAFGLALQHVQPVQVTLGLFAVQRDLEVEDAANLLAEARFGVPAFGTMAHSFIQAHDSERAAFEHFATARPDNLVLLIDTYDYSAPPSAGVTEGQRISARARSTAERGFMPGALSRAGAR